MNPRTIARLELYGVRAELEALAWRCRFPLPAAFVDARMRVNVAARRTIARHLFSLGSSKKRIARVLGVDRSSVRNLLAPEIAAARYQERKAA